MRNSSENIISAQSLQSNSNSSAVPATQILSVSAQAVVGSGALGTLKLQFSNDKPNQSGGPVAGPTNWSDVTSASIAVSGAGLFAIQKTEVCAQYLRLVYTSTAIGIQTVTTVADVAGSLNSTYFLLDSANGGTNYYVWINVDSGGVDPAIAGRTGVPVAIAEDDTAADIATAVAAAIDALATFAAAAVGPVVTVTNSAGGPFVSMVDGEDPTGFAFATTTPTGSITANLNSYGF